MTFSDLFSFTGRVGRGYWWGVQLAVFGTVFVLALTEVEGLFLVAWLAGAWVGLATNVKRLHDRDKSGWFLLIGLIPFVGNLCLLIEMGFLSGSHGTNRYGEPAIGQSLQPAGSEPYRLNSDQP